MTAVCTDHMEPFINKRPLWKGHVEGQTVVGHDFWLNQMVKVGLGYVSCFYSSYSSCQRVKEGTEDILFLPFVGCYR